MGAVAVAVAVALSGFAERENPWGDQELKRLNNVAVIDKCNSQFDNVQISCSTTA